MELLVEDYFYDLAFNDLKCKEYCDRLEKTLLRIIERKDINYMRLVPATVHILTLNGRIDKAIQVRAELTATITSSMWDMYNHREYEEANKVAEQLITIDSENVEARYVKALCLTRFDEDDEAKKILDNLLEENADNAARYYYALGRIQKKQGKYNKAIELYKTAILNRRRYLSPYRELAECYILMDNISDAKIAIENAKKIDESNVFVILLEARLLQKEDCADKAIELLENQSIFEKEPAQIFFRKGRVFDQLGNKEQAKEKAIEMLKLTGIPNPENCFKQYPYELSGGMQQRVMIAMALSCEPKLLIADEPTTALDVTIQEQILQLIRELNEKLGMSVLFITHDMGAVANLCHNVKVMYLGQVVEEASTEELFQNPLHPYTQGLLSCIPHLGVKKGEPLPVIEGSVPPLSKVPVGCHFCTRCKMADQHCMEHEPPACEVAPGHVVKCWKYAESGKQEV